MITNRNSFKNETIAQIMQTAISVDKKYQALQEECIKTNSPEIENIFLIYKRVQSVLSRAINEINKAY